MIQILTWLKRIARLDQHFAWSALGVLITIWLAFFRESKSLKFEILANTSVVDTKEAIGLDVSYGGRNLRATGETLSIVAVKIINDGNVSILKEHYDESVPVTFGVSNGIVSSSIPAHDFNTPETSYLQWKIHGAWLADQKRLVFPPAIIDPGEFAIFKLFVVHKQNENLVFRADGKVSGIKNIEIITSYADNDSGWRGLWRKGFNGNGRIQLSRLLLYGIAFVLIVFFIGTFLFYILNFIERFRRKGLIGKFRRITVQSSELQTLLDIYLELGDGGMIFLESMMFNRWQVEYAAKVHSQTDKTQTRSGADMVFDKVTCMLLDNKVFSDDRSMLNSKFTELTQQFIAHLRASDTEVFEKHARIYTPSVKSFFSALQIGSDKYGLLANHELAHQAGTLITKLRGSLTLYKRDSRKGISLQQSDQVAENSSDYLIAQYEQLKIEALLLRRELAKRLAPYKSKLLDEQSYLNPVNPIGINDVTDELDMLRQQLQ